MKNVIFVVFSALGILCYECTPDEKQLCDAPSNVTNCTGMYDICAVVGLNVNMTNPATNVTNMARVMTCAVKVSVLSLLVTDDLA